MTQAGRSRALGAAGALLGCALVASATGAAAETVATVGRRTITRGQLEEHVRPQLVEIEQARYEALREGLDELVAEALLGQEAAARSTSPEALAKEEIEAKVPEPGEVEIQRVYDANKAQLGGQSLEQVKGRIVEYLKTQATAAREAAFVEELKGKYRTSVALRPPVVEVATAGRPERGGGPTAPVTIVEFSDYECPFCKRAEDVVDQVAAAYGDKVRIVFRDFPLEMHANARTAAEAAHCAHAQGKFWPFHAKLFANQQALGLDDLRTYAGEIGLDRAAFDECLAERRFKAAVEQDMADGAKAGVSGTPAFFVNGRMLSGVQPFEKFKEVIDEELAARSPSPSS
jgi:protein-disulfide isomerase